MVAIFSKGHEKMSSLPHPQATTGLKLVKELENI